MLFAFRASILRITLALQGFQSALLRGPKDANLVRMVVTVLFRQWALKLTAHWVIECNRDLTSSIP